MPVKYIVVATLCMYILQTTFLVIVSIDSPRDYYHFLSFPVAVPKMTKKVHEEIYKYVLTY